MFVRSSTTVFAFLCFVGIQTSVGVSQQCYVLKPTLVYEDVPVTNYRWQAETSYQQIELQEEKPFVTTETRYRKQVTYKPIVRDRVLEERFDVYKPVVETSYSEQQINEEAFEYVTEMRTEKVLVAKPIRETRYRDESILVPKTVEKTVFEASQVTSFRPQTQLETNYTTANLPVLGTLPTVTGSHLQWLGRGYYYDPNQQAMVFRRGGLHWVQDSNPTALVGVSQPVLVPQQTEKIVLVPETTQVLKPKTVTSLENVVETRRVPYEIETVQQVYETRQVPVTVRKPVIKTRTEKVPVETTRYETQEMVRRTPYQETVGYEPVEVSEPYEVQVTKYVSETKAVSVPKTVYKQVPYQTTVRVPKTVLAPYDLLGNPLPIARPTMASMNSVVPESNQNPPKEISEVGRVVASRPQIENPNGYLGSFRNANGDTMVLKDRKIVDPTSNNKITTSSPSKDPEYSVLESGLRTRQLIPIRIESQLAPKSDGEKPADNAPQIDPPALPTDPKLVPEQ